MKWKDIKKKLKIVMDNMDMPISNKIDYMIMILEYYKQWRRNHGED